MRALHGLDSHLGLGRYRKPLLFAIMALLLVAVGIGQGWNVSLAILNLCLVSAIMALGLNIQWGYAGIFNAGVMGFAALGGVAAVLVSHPPIPAGWAVGGSGLLAALAVLLATVAAVVVVRRYLPKGTMRFLLVAVVIVCGYGAVRWFYNPAVDAIEAVDPAHAGFLGGLGLPIVFSWLIGGLLAAAAAWVIGKVALGLRLDYLAIATLGISEIIVTIIRNEDWLVRGVKNVTGLPRVVPREVDLQAATWFSSGTASLGLEPAAISGIAVKAAHATIVLVVLALLLVLANGALRSPWGRMMRAIRDNEQAAEAMGKDVTGRHLQVFVLGSAVIGVAGAILVTLDGQFTPGSYSPLRFTFLIWLMVIVGGAGNNWGAVLGGFVVWFVWIEAEPAAQWMFVWIAALLGPDDALVLRLSEAAPHMRMVLMGLILLLVMRFSPGGLIPEGKR